VSKSLLRVTGPVAAAAAAAAAAGAAAAVAAVVCRDASYRVGKALCSKLKELIPRQMFRVPIQVRPVEVG
jgi:translation elongation factor EF-4